MQHGRGREKLTSMPCSPVAAQCKTLPFWKTKELKGKTFIKPALNLCKALNTEHVLQPHMYKVSLYFNSYSSSAVQTDFFPPLPQNGR